VKTLAKVMESQLLGVDNVCTLEEVNPAALLHTIKVRYGRTQIYTRVSRILIAINPFQALNIYSSQYIDKYKKALDSMDEAPHVYGIGVDALNGLRNGSRSQAVLISGESGAGKTESTKLILAYLAEAMGSGRGGLQDKVMQTNPILESFGNAMTARNNNSSRFGKWMQIAVNLQSMKIIDCRVNDYLLELPRICSPAATERNYHVFFQLAHCRDRPELKALGIMEPKKYNYLSGCQEKAPGIDDDSFFQDLKNSFDGLGVTQDVQTEIFATVAGILALGNCDFADHGDECKSTDKSALNKAAEMLGVNPNVLEHPMLIRKIVVGKEVTEAPRNATQAKTVRDSLAKLIYGRLFKWLVARVNKALADEGGASSNSFFGVLDIYGFESFEKNSLEQLFINLSNEHLQLHFNNHIFKMELDDYAREGINVAGGITFQDNSDIVALIAEKGGILAILDDQVNTPKATDESFTAHLYRDQEKHKRLIKPKFNNKTTFGLQHFAGDVIYSCEGFLDKNVDKPPDDAPGLLESSSRSVLKDIAQMMKDDLAAADAGAPKVGRGKKTVTIGSNFRKSLTDLMGKVSEADPHFIRCVKPNKEKIADKFDANLVMHQLMCSGVMEAVRIRQQGFAARMPFKDFLGRFKVIVPRSVRVGIVGSGAAGSEQDRVHKFTAALTQGLSAVGGVQQGELMVGKSKVFLRARLQQALERARDLGIAGYVLDIQRVYRGMKIRKLMKQVKVVYQELSGWMTQNNFYTKPGSQSTAVFKHKTFAAIETEVGKGSALLEKARNLPIPMPEKNAKNIEKTMQRMENEVIVLKQVKGLLKSLEPVAIDKALTRAAELELPRDGDIENLTSRSARLKTQMPLAKAMQDALNNQDVSQLQAVMEAVKEQGLNTHPDNWIAELNAVDMAGRVYDQTEKLKTQQKQTQIEQDRKAALENQSNQAQRVGQAQVHQFEAEVKPAAAAPKPEEPKGRRKTITGLSGADQDKVLMQLLGAGHEFDADKLEAALAEATSQGIDQKELAKASQLLTALQTEAYIASTMDTVAQKIQNKDETAMSLRQLQNLVKQANNLGVAQGKVAEVRPVMQQGVRMRARSTIKGSVFEHIDIEEIALLQGAFKDLSTFPGLKDVQKWRGHRSSRTFTRGARGGEVMLCHSSNEIKEALTTVPAGLENAAVQTFRDILGWMTDRPVPESQRLGYAQDIVETAKSERPLADEVYVQVMKQLESNPSVRSKLMGWKLLLLLTQHVSPSEKLEEFVRAFLIRAISESRREGDAGQEVEAIAKQCVADLNILAQPDRIESMEMIPVQVLLIDNSTRKVYIQQDATLGDLAKKMAEQLKIHNSSDFSFFQLTEGLETHRLLPETTILLTLSQKWMKLKEVTGRASRLLFKRRFLRVDETLNAGDLVHATLTYRQVIWDYLHYPVSEDLGIVNNIAGTIVCSEMDHFKPYIQQGKLHEQGILEQVLPDHSLRDQPRTKWAKQIQEVVTRVEATIDPMETRILKMSRVMSLIQRMKLFGAYHWLGKQTFQVSPEKVSVPEAPPQMCKVNPKEPEAEYWICVDLFGVRFVSVDSAPGRGFQRGFLFNEEALERVLRWGAKQNVVQFVVQTINPAVPAQGRVPMSISLVSPAAIDIAYAVHVICNDRRSRQR